MEPSDTIGKGISVKAEPLRILRAGASRLGPDGGASYYILDGWARAVRAVGWEMRTWDGTDPETTFDSFRPHIYMADVRFRHRVPRLVRRGEVKVVMTVDQWSDPIAFPALAANGYRTRRAHVRWVRQLAPEFLYHHTSPSGIARGWACWTTHEHRRVVSIPLAADTETYFDEGTDPRFNVDIGFLGGYTRYKAPGLHEFLLDLLPEFRTLIYGPGWPAGVVAGSQLPDRDRNRFFRTVRISPAIHEPHARLYGHEITERLFKVPLAGGFTIADGVASIHEDGFFSPDEVPNAKNGHEMRELIRHFIANPGEREEFAQRARSRVLREHTYFHRLAKFLEELGLNSHVAYLREAMTQRGIGELAP